MWHVLRTPSLQDIFLSSVSSSQIKRHVSSTRCTSFALSRPPRLCLQQSTATVSALRPASWCRLSLGPLLGLTPRAAPRHTFEGAAAPLDSYDQVRTSASSGCAILDSKLWCKNWYQLCERYSWDQNAPGVVDEWGSAVWDRALWDSAGWDSAVCDSAIWGRAYIYSTVPCETVL